MIETHARNNDPWTSHEAAARRHDFAGGHCEIILECLQRFGPLNKDQIAMHTGLSSVQVDRRLPDLKKRGQAYPTGEVRPSHSGRAERVWSAA